jgi:hypothetical protein
MSPELLGRLADPTQWGPNGVVILRRDWRTGRRCDTRSSPAHTGWSHPSLDEWDQPIFRFVSGRLDLGVPGSGGGPSDAPPGTK